MVLIQKNGPARIGDTPVDTAEIADLADGDIVAFRYDYGTGKLVPFRFATHEDHKLTLTANGDYIHLNAAP